MTEQEKKENQKTVVAFAAGLLIGGLLVWVFGGSAKTEKVADQNTDAKEKVTEVSTANTDTTKTTEETATPKEEAKKVAPAVPAAPEHQGPYNVGGEVSPPQALYAPSAPYTEQARKANVQGTVVLGIVINDHGKVTDISVLSPGQT